MWTCVTISNTEARCDSVDKGEVTISWDGTTVTAGNSFWEGSFAGDDLIDWRKTTTGETGTWAKQGKRNIT